MGAPKNFQLRGTFSRLSDVVFSVTAFFHLAIFFLTYILHVTLFSILASLYLLVYGSPLARAFIISYLIFARLSKQHIHAGYDVVRNVLPANILFAAFNPTWRFLCKHFFPITLVKTAKLGCGSHMIVVHPHGIIPFTALYSIVYDGAGWNKLFPGTATRVPQVINVFFYIPFVREYLLLNEVGSAERSSIKNTLRSGRSSVLVPGGAKEAMLIPQNNEVLLVLKSRKGFVRIAMEERVPLVPTYCFGTHDAYKQYDVGGIVAWVQRKIKAVASVSAPIFIGSCFLLPKRTALKAVVGAPIRTDDYEGELTEELVDKKHEEYKKALAELFEKHRGNFYPPEYKLTYV